MFRNSIGLWAWTLMGIGAASALTGEITSGAEPAAAARGGGPECRLRTAPEEPKVEPAETAPAPAPVPERPELRCAVTPKPLGESARKGLAWLVARQHEDGGWNQGEDVAIACEERAIVDGPGQPVPQREGSNVADTCMAALALVRSGSTPSSGEHAAALRRAIAFVCAKVEASDDESLWVTDVRGTRVQSKIGTYVDTFLASMLLSEVRDAAGGEADRRADAALSKVLAKIERNQRDDGSYDHSGWAPVLSQSLAGKALNRAAQRGSAVSNDALEGNDDFFMARGAGLAGEPSAGAAGVLLYDGAAKLGALQESVLTASKRERELKDAIAKEKDGEKRAELEQSLAQIDLGRRAQEEVQTAVVGRLDQPEFVSGFGSNGGEEFLSYMNISESLVVRADDAWRKWDGSIGENLARVQNQDGSWNGHHCITGRTFCTSAALLVLMADRIQFPADLLAEAR